MADSCIPVTAGVILGDGGVLACQRVPGGRHPYKWEFPGGKVEAGENLEAALRRELREELGIEATIGRVLWETRHRYPGRDPIALTFFLVPVYTGTVINRVFAAIEWLPFSELPRRDFLDADREFVAALARREVRLTEVGGG